MTKQELIKYFGISESTINTNFPLFCQKQLAKGFLISRIGVGKNAQYTIEKVEPKVVDKSYFSQRKNSKEELQNEEWISAYIPGFEVSTEGRIRNARTKVIHQGCISEKGYLTVSLNGTSYSAHRIIKQSFDPIENFKDLTVDHLNGIRTDNTPNNLEWVSSEENTLRMLLHRKEMNVELTRIINQIGYDETLKLLQSLENN